MQLQTVNGDLLDQDVDVIVNAWNRNIIPWWLLLPQGVSGAIKNRGGYAPFRELGKLGPITLTGAIITGAGITGAGITGAGITGAGITGAGITGAGITGAGITGAGITGAGKLPFKSIIHVAGISMWWRSSEQSIRDSVRNALALATQHNFQSIALPLIGAGTGGGSADEVLTMIEHELSTCDFDGLVRIVRFQR